MNDIKILIKKIKNSRNFHFMYRYAETIPVTVDANKLLMN